MLTCRFSSAFFVFLYHQISSTIFFIQIEFLTATQTLLPDVENSSENYLAGTLLEYKSSYLHLSLNLEWSLSPTVKYVLFDAILLYPILDAI